MKIKQDNCYVGSQFIVMLEPVECFHDFTDTMCLYFPRHQDLALVSYQCENSKTGRQMLMYLQEMDGGETCPFQPEVDAELTQRELSRSNLDK